MLYPQVHVFTEKVTEGVELWVVQWRIQGGGGGGRPPLAHIFLKKLPLPRIKAYSPLCAFAIKDDGADALYSAPL